MTTLVVEEITDSAISQSFTYNKRKGVIAAIRPYIYKHLNPSGTYTLTLKDSGDNTLATKSLTSAEIEAASDDITASNYFHGKITFEFDYPVNVSNGDYTVEMVSDTPFSESAYMAWVFDYDDEERLNTEDYTIAAVSKAPLSMEIWKYKLKTEF